MDRDNRKSHLAPQLSPATRELLRSSDSPTYLTQADQTPTSGEIPNSGGSSVVSHRDQSSSVPSRPPARRGSSQPGRSGGSPVYPGVGPRVATVHAPISEPRRQSPRAGEEQGGAGRGSSSRGADAAVFFSLPMRPAPPPSGPLPPPPPPPPLRRLVTAEELRRESQQHVALRHASGRPF